MSKVKYYIASFRLRTLPLSLSGIFLGTLLAKAAGYFHWLPFLLAVATTLSLQILSNLANELGDLQKGQTMPTVWGLSGVYNLVLYPCQSSNG